MAHTHPAPTIVASSTGSASGTSLAFSLPGGSYVVDDQIHCILLLFQAAATTTNPTTTATGWTRRDRHASSGGAGILVLDYWTRFYDGSVTTVTFSTSVSATALAVFLVIDSHSGAGTPFFVSPQLQQFANPNHTTLDPRYFQGGTISPHEAVRQLAVAILAGADDGGSVGDPSGGPTGYDLRGLSGSGARLWVATKQTGLDQEEDPGYSTLGVGGSVFQTPGGGWVWSGFGTPENDDGGGGAASGTSVFQPISMMNTWHYHEYVADVEEEFPYWGLLGAMT